MTWFPRVEGDTYLLPSFLVRGYVPIGARDSVEIGFIGRAGAFVADSTSFAWIGIGLSVGANVRYWLVDAFGLELSIDGIAASGKTTTSPPDPNSYARDSAGLLVVGGSLSLVFRF